MIHLALPNATILHTTRHPLDTCLGMYRRNFAHGHDAAFDLADIARWYVTYRQTMDHWQAVLPGRIVRVPHASIVAEPEASMRRLYDLCGIPWKPAALRFWEAPEAARQGGREEVRRPLHDEGVGRWRQYERHLGPLIEALGPYAHDR